MPHPTGVALSPSAPEQVSTLHHQDHIRANYVRSASLSFHQSILAGRPVGIDLVQRHFVDLSQKKEVADLVQRDLIRVNNYLPEAARVKRFVLLHKEFDPDEAELTRTKKLRRDFMEARYKDLIKAMYSGEQSVNVEASVTYRDGRKGVVTTAIKVRSI